jgi:hypothetical protein
LLDKQLEMLLCVSLVGLSLPEALTDIFCDVAFFSTILAEDFIPFLAAAPTPVAFLPSSVNLVLTCLVFRVGFSFADRVPTILEHGRSTKSSSLGAPRRKKFTSSGVDPDEKIRWNVGLSPYAGGVSASVSSSDKDKGCLSKPTEPQSLLPLSLLSSANDENHQRMKEERSEVQRYQLAVHMQAIGEKQVGVTVPCPEK